MNSEIITLIEIIKHQKMVSFFLREVSRRLAQRADLHDLSKLYSDEFEGFCGLNIARKYEYGSTEYEAAISGNQAVSLHLSRNSHHPENHPNGIKDMDLLDIIEMLCDWEVARITRDTTQDIEDVWIARQKRFGLSNEDLSFLRRIWDGMQMHEPESLGG